MEHRSHLLHPVSLCDSAVLPRLQLQFTSVKDEHIHDISIIIIIIISLSFQAVASKPHFFALIFLHATFFSYIHLFFMSCFCFLGQGEIYELIILDITYFNVFFFHLKLVRFKVLHIYRHPLVITPYYSFHMELCYSSTGGHNFTQR